MSRNRDERGPAGQALHAFEHLESIAIRKLLIEQHEVPFSASFERSACLFGGSHDRDLYSRSNE